MDEPDMNDRDSAQRAKLIFILAGAVTTIVLVGSLFFANKARSERDALKQEIEPLRQDNAKMEQLLKDQNGEIDALRKKLQQCESKPAPKAESKKKKASDGTKKSGKAGKKSSKKAKHKHSEDR